MVKIVAELAEEEYQLTPECEVNIKNAIVEPADETKTMKGRSPGPRSPRRDERVLPKRTSRGRRD